MLSICRLLNLSVAFTCYIVILARFRGSCDKILGVHVDENLVWNSQFQHVIEKVSSYFMAF